MTARLLHELFQHSLRYLVTPAAMTPAAVTLAEVTLAAVTLAAVTLAAVMARIGTSDAKISSGLRIFFLTFDPP